MNKRVLFTILTILGLIMMESPVILFANTIDPMILGLPFLVFWVLFWWAFCTIVFFVAFKMNWGKN